LISSATCIASSLVGVNIRACTFLLSFSNLSNIGSAKDAVLPVQVCA
jgi:hypothetical protein